MRRMLALGPALLCATGIAASCGRGVDVDEARICRRAIPALEPAGMTLTLGPARPGRDVHEVRIDYQAALGGAARARFVLCRFGAVRPTVGKPDLEAVTTAGGVLPGATLYLLKRYYLDRADEAEVNPSR